MRHFMSLGSVLVCALSLSACASITRGTTTAWEVRTRPVGARVTTSTGQSCTSTPCSIVMSRKSGFDATITKPGYKPLTVKVTTKISSGGGMGMAGNVLVGGLIGAGVDVATGAMNDLTPNPVDVELEKEYPGSPVGTSVEAPAPGTAPSPAPAVDQAPAATSSHGN